ncbi:hypothetical protein J2Z66_003699 [Paenibacillus eucommiae]|uniref:Uncharacterized protein n=1 Tax=Paenibacillus eucommiae TaxID=1355755 RepID=A0ABS4IWW8_9BACL|nr:hypothetical protein [Paenibacillus eucommiae]
MARGEISSDPEPPFKTLAGCPFELGVHAIHAIRTIVAEEREWLWTEER